MSKIIYPLGILLTIIIGAYLQYIFCCPAVDTAETEEPQKIVETVPEKITNPLVIKDSQGSFDYGAKQENINFKSSDFKILSPIAKEAETGILKLIAYLNDNPNKSIDITGYYKSSESYSGALPNLGVARATEVKNYLVSKGANSQQINTSGQLQDELIADGETLLGPVDFGIITNDEADKAAEEEELKLLAKKIKDDPLVLYFNTNESKISLTAEQRQKVSDIAKYLDKISDAQCLVVGHTDSRGKLRKNIELGQKRADFVKTYLISNGISADKIESSSQGPKKPIASNRTKKGQAKNRRTVVTLK